MGRLVMAAAVAGFLALAACGGQPTDGGWLTTGSGWAMFIQISGGTGTVDYAYLRGTATDREDGTVVVHNDGTLEVDGMVDGPIDSCSTCQYQVQNGNLVIDAQYMCYGTCSGDTGSETLTFTPGDVSTYDSDASSLSSSGG
jgi:hypothetical protein